MRTATPPSAAQSRLRGEPSIRLSYALSGGGSDANWLAGTPSTLRRSGSSWPVRVISGASPTIADINE